MLPLKPLVNKKNEEPVETDGDDDDATKDKVGLLVEADCLLSATNLIRMRVGGKLASDRYV